MILKVLEVRDEATCIPVVAIRMAPGNPVEAKYLWRYGFPPDGSGVILITLSDQRATSDAYSWAGGSRGTLCPAHLYIESHWDILNDGDVIDSRVIRGEAIEAVEAEIWP